MARRTHWPRQLAMCGWACIGLACARDNPAFDALGGTGGTGLETATSLADGADDGVMTAGGDAAVTSDTSATNASLTSGVDATMTLDTAETGVTTGDGPFVVSDCCVAHGGTGCEELDVETCVCALDVYCCDTQWDAVCAARAATDCGASCPGHCCAINESPGCEDATVANEVCAIDPTCCTETWSADCAQLAQPHLSCTNASDCCTPQGAAMPLCNDPTVVACVCGQDPFCCDTSWDGICVNAAISACGLEGCDTPPPVSCCVASNAPGCVDEPTTTNVCAMMPGCCTETWTQACADAAIEAGFCDSNQDCCSPGLSAGCSDNAAMLCACPADPFCCSTQWDANCVVAAENCGLCPA
jgi:hypothetical protein